MPAERVAAVGEILPGTLRRVEVFGRSLVVANVEGALYAVDGVCPHAQGPLGEGALEGKALTCPWHGWEFDVTTGVSLSDPPACVQSFPVTIDGDQVRVELPG